MSKQTKVLVTGAAGFIYHEAIPTFGSSPMMAIYGHSGNPKILRDELLRYVKAHLYD